jgi:LysM repeat protein
VSKIKWIAPLLVILALSLVLGGCSRKQDPTDDGLAPTWEEPTSGGEEEEEGPGQALEQGSALTDAGALPSAGSPGQVYFVEAGDTLSGIAALFGCSVDDLMEANPLADPNALQIGQQLNIPSTIAEPGPAVQLLPNSEFVNGPAYVDFDLGVFTAQQGGYLFTYQEYVDGQLLNGPEIVGLVAHHYSVGPRLLLAVLEYESGWVTQADPSLYVPLGSRGGGWDTFASQLAWAANRLNEGYYNWRGRGMPLIVWSDGSTSSYAPTLNAATAALQYFFALNSTKSDWEVIVDQGRDSFLETYRSLFGDPDQYAIEPLIPAGIESPTLSLPFAEGELWYYTGGPHGGWDFGSDRGSAWAAVDFVPDEGFLGCAMAASWARAAAPGLVIYSQNGEVMIDLDGDGYEETGWVLFYLHVGSQGRVAVDTYVQPGDPIGHPSCEGGFSQSTHLHLARKYNGEWIAADGPLPLILSGWQFHASSIPYDGTATRSNQERTACECRDPDFNGLTVGR